MGDIAPERMAQLRAKAAETRATAVRDFWDTPATVASILMTTARRGRITLRAAKEVWGARGEKITRKLVGEATYPLAIEDAAAADIHFRTLAIGSDEVLILTRFGRKLADASEFLADIGAHIDAGRSAKKARRARG